MKHFALVMVLLGLASLAQGEKGMRTQPPTLASVSPTGVVRGQTVGLTVEGSNLTGATRVFFSTPGLSGRVIEVTEAPQEPERRTGVGSSLELGPRPLKNHVQVEVTAAADAEIGVHRFRLLTPLGTSNTAVLAVSPFPEVMEGKTAEAEADPGDAGKREVKLPATLVGNIRKAGEVDSFLFPARAGEQMVFQILAPSLGSALEPVLTLRDAGGKELASTREMALIHTFQNAGQYKLEVRDYEHRGGMRYFYRVNAGAYPYLAGAFPLGVAGDGEAEISLRGANLAGMEKLKVKAAAGPGSRRESLMGAETLLLAPPQAVNRVRLAVGRWPEVMEREPNDDPSTAQPVPVPVTINGKIAAHTGAGSATPDRDYFRFTAKKGQRLVLEVTAQLLGSPLDSVIEVLDAQGRPVEHATLRPLFETAVTLSDPDSSRTGMRILSWTGINVNDYVLVGNELLKVALLPRTPDEDIQFVSFRGQRVGFEDTTPENHAVNTPLYKVQVHPPGRQFPPNGMPIVRLYYRNDDRGTMASGAYKDSLLHFTAPANGDYLVRIADVRGLEDERFAYRLTIREPAPDFLLAADPQNPNAPRGGNIGVRVTALRLDGMDAPIEVRAEGLPAGVIATTGVIPPGQNSTMLLLSAAPDASLAEPAAFRVVGRAGSVERVADAEEKLKLLALMPPPDLKVWLEPTTITLEPGQQAEVTVKVERGNGFTGRVPVEIRNLPPGVMIPGIGLNGVLVTEQETSRKFTLLAEPWAQPITQPLYALGRVETRSPTPSLYSSPPLELQVRPREILAKTPANP